MTTFSSLRAPDRGLVAELEEAGLVVGARPTDRLARAHDASHYLLTPEVVVTPATVDEVGRVFSVARRRRVAVTLRSGGTSLSGQAGTDGILVDVRRHFREIEVLDEGRAVRAQPGATVRAVNTRLARHGRKIGPDPASEIACTIGGVVSNNSSGMCCGTHENAYRTLSSAVIALPSGLVLDTGSPDAGPRLRQAEPDLWRGLERLRDRVCSNPESVATLRRLHAIKNTMGYGLNAFLDFTDPVKILEHLIVGSEGTLAFIAEATFETVPVKPHAATGLLVFTDLASATAALEDLVDAGFAAIELLDAASLRVARSGPDATPDLAALDVVHHAALLVEFQEHTATDLEARLESASDLLRRLPLTAPAKLSTDAAFRSQLWRMRKGLFAAVAGARASGTTALLEDIAVPVDRLSHTCAELIRLFEKHGYAGSVIFGHAKDGNVHFLINERFDDPRLLARYEAFTEDMVTLVLAQGGTLKAEHGTGRIMAPYVERQYGQELHAVMWEVKRLIDPAFLLSPEVVLTEDPRAHTKNLKTVPTVEEEVDRCVECGYCEPVCPSRNLTLTPRERIALRREVRNAESHGDAALVRALEAEYAYDGVDTCAVDGMCQSACPVLINTGDLVRRLREEAQNRLAQTGWRFAAKNWNSVTAAGGAALTVAGALPGIVSTTATRIARSVLGADNVPLYTSDLPRGGRRRHRIESTAPDAIYFSSCTNTMFGPVGNAGVDGSFLQLCARAGIELATPPDLPNLCCGTPWKSKGLSAGYVEMASQVGRALDLATDRGRLPVVCDASSCTEGLRALLEGAGKHIEVVDAVSFVDARVLPRLPKLARVASLTLHPTCSSSRLGIDAALRRVAAAAAEVVVIPEEWGCCAYAGDRGMLHPELTARATAEEVTEVRDTASEFHASLNRTCELGMSRATGQDYMHVLEVLERAAANVGDSPPR